MLHHIISHIGGMLQDVPGNPAPVAPPGADKPVNTLMQYLKWGVLVVIIAAAFVGAGAIAGGRVFAHHGASKIGVGILLAAIGGAIVYVSAYAVITGLTG